MHLQSKRSPTIKLLKSRKRKEKKVFYCEQNLLGFLAIGIGRRRLQEKDCIFLLGYGSVLLAQKKKTKKTKAKELQEEEKESRRRVKMNRMENERREKRVVEKNGLG